MLAGKSRDERRFPFHACFGQRGLSLARTNLALCDYTLMPVRNGSNAILVVAALSRQNSNDLEASAESGIISAWDNRHRLPGCELVSGYHLGSTNLFAG